MTKKRTSQNITQTLLFELSSFVSKKTTLNYTSMLVSLLYKVYYNAYVVHKLCHNDNYCHTVIPGKAATLKYNQGQKSIRFLFLNYAVTKSLLEDQLEPCAVVITTAQLHSTKPELRFCAGSNPARGVSEIRDGKDLWQWSRLEIRLYAFRRSIIPQKQFIIIIHIAQPAFTCSKLKIKALKQGMKYVNNKDTITTSAVNFEHIITGRDCPI